MKDIRLIVLLELLVIAVSLAGLNAKIDVVDNEA